MRVLNFIFNFCIVLSSVLNHERKHTLQMSQLLFASFLDLDRIHFPSQQKVACARIRINQILIRNTAFVDKKLLCYVEHSCQG